MKISKELLRKKAHLCLYGFAIAALSYKALSPAYYTPQNEIDVEYKRLYSLIKAEKAKAKKQNKSFVILLGENHENKNSLLGEFLAQDIAQRLDINQALTEDDELSLSWKQVSALGASFEFIHSSKNILENQIQVLNFFRNLPYSNDANADIQLNQNRITDNSSFALVNGDYMNFEYSPGDPWIHKRNKIADDARADGIPTNEILSLVQTPESDAVMAKAVENVAKKSNCIAFYGCDHIAEVKEMLEKKNIAVLALNFGFVSERNLNGVQKDLQPFYRPTFSTYNPISAARALSMALQASIKHRQECNELTPQQADQYLKKIKSITFPKKNQFQANFIG